MRTTKWTGREHLTKYAFWLGPAKPTDKENQVNMYEKYLLFEVHLPFWKIRIQIHIKQSNPDPYEIDKQDPDPDPYHS